MPEVNKTYDARMSKPRPLARSWKWVVGAAAGLAVITGVLINIKAIVGVVEAWWPKKPTASLRIGWLTVADPATLSKCIFAKGNTFRLQQNESAILVGESACKEELIRRTSSTSETPQEQSVGKSYFLLVENQGDQIETLNVLNRAAASTPTASFRQIAKGGRIAVCMGFEGRSGSPSQMDKSDEIETVRATNRRATASVPAREKSTAMGVSDCGPITWNYP